MRVHLISALAATVVTLAGTAEATPVSTTLTPSSQGTVATQAPQLVNRFQIHAARPGVEKAPKSPELALRAMAPEAGGLELRATGTDTFGDGDTIVRFGQLHRGLPVLNAGASVRLGPDGDARLAVTAFAKDLPGSVTPTVPSEAAAQAARARLGNLPISVDARDARLAIHVLRGTARLAWVFVPAVPTGVSVAPRILVDANTGEVLEARDMAQFATAHVYATNPVKSPTLASMPFAIDPTVANKLSNPFIEAYNCRGTGVVKKVTVQGFTLNMRACELAQSATPTSAGAFDYTPVDDAAHAKEASEDVFSEVSIYYHVARIYSFFRGLQGSADAQITVEKPLRAVANLRIDSAIAKGNIAGLPGAELVPMSNAFYSPAGGGLGDVFTQLYGFDQGSMWFFQGPKRDYAYDGDVVYHEFTHAVVNATIQLGAWHVDAFGMMDSPGAMNEGLADYFSSALAGDPDVGEYASQDIAANMTAIRTLANQDKCPTSIAGEVHYDSTLFSGALWSARSSLASAEDRAKFDAALYKALRNAPGQGDVGYEDVGNLFLASLRQDLPAGEKALDKSLTERGILPSCSRVFEYAGAPISAPKASQMPGFTAPGKQTLGPGLDLAPGIVQARLALPDHAIKVKVSFTAGAQGGGLGGLGGGGTPFKPVVLGKWDSAVTWDTTKVTSNAEVRTDAVKSGTSDWSATFAVPEGKKSVNVQIANAGDSDGSYNGLTIETEIDPAAGTGGGSGGDGPVTTRPVEGTVTAPVPQPEPAKAGGCGCSVPGTAQGGAGAALAGLGLALAVAGRRRRR